MMDPLREAMKRRKSKAVDLTIVMGGESDPKHEAQEDQALHGDLAPEVHDGSDPDKLAAERKAMHAKEADTLKEAVAEHEGSLSEHHDSPETAEDMTGINKPDGAHGGDPEIEAFMQKGHEHDTLTKPKTLGARVRAALYNKKKGM